jgi:enoyl-CoA hydratase/carnithine racemase
MECKVTQCTIENRVGTVYLDRPRRGNSWTMRMNIEYRWRMAQLNANPNDYTVGVEVYQNSRPPKFSSISEETN